MCNYHHHLSPKLISSCITETQCSSNTNSPFLPPLRSQQPHSTLCLYEFDYPGYHIGRSQSICFYFFVIGLISLSITSSSFLHMVACVRTFFLFKAEYYAFAGICHILFIHPSIARNLNCHFDWLLWIMLL